MSSPQTAPALSLALVTVPRRSSFGPVVVAAVVVSAFAFAPVPLARGPLAALAASLSIMALLPPIGRVPSHVWGPLVGMVTLVVGPSVMAGAFPQVGLSALTAEVVGGLDVIVLILSLAYLASSLDDSGFFRWCALRVTRAAAGDGTRLLLWTFLGVSALTFFTSNDIVILAVTPILIHIAVQAKIRNVTPLLFAQFFAANTASMGLYIGNPTNMVIGRAAGMGFTEYAQRMWLPTLVATGATLGLLWWLFAHGSRDNRMVRRYRMPPADDAIHWTSHMTAKVALFAGCLATLTALGSDFGYARTAGGAGRLVVHTCAAFALLALLHDLWCDRSRVTGEQAAGVRRRIVGLPFEIVPFFVAFCVLLHGLSEVGLVERAADRVVAAFGYGPVIGSVATGVYGVVTTNLLNNIPTSMLVGKTLEAGSSSAGLAERLATLDAGYADAFVEASLFATNVGANLTFMGALAGVMWLRILRRSSDGNDAPRVPSAREFLCYGALVVPAVTLLTCSVIGLSHGGPTPN